MSFFVHFSFFFFWSFSSNKSILLSEANRSLQDTNDSLRAHMDTAVLTPLRRSPLPDGAKMSSVSAPTGLILPEDLPLAQHHSTEGAQDDAYSS